LYTSAEKNLKGYVNFGTWALKQKPIRTDTSDGDKDMEANFYVLRGTSCPAVLTENMFQDNKDDISYLTSDLGKHEIIRTHVEGILWFLENRNL
jgi:N-acetylmuramoyl-L-alanine amidase